MTQLLAALVLIVLTSGIAQSSRAADDKAITTLWTKANRLSADPARQEDLGHVLDEMSAACRQVRAGTRVQLLHAAECKRWVGERWIALGRFDAAGEELRYAYRTYATALGSVNPLSGEVLHLLAQVYREQGALREARLAMDRALMLLPPIDRGDIERCRAVYGTSEPVWAADSCAAGLATHEMAEGVVHLKRPEHKSKHIEFGELEIPDGRMFRGFHRNGRRSGQGLEIDADGQQFWSGTYRGGSLNGRAIWLHVTDGKTASYYAGCWKDGRRHGYGTVLYENGNRYVGEFRNGFPNGSGEFRWQGAGSHYIGEVADSDLNGTGTLVIPGLLEYTGSWKAGSRHGAGTERFVDGLLEYRGAYVEGKPSGMGRLLINQREVFAGEFHPEKGPGFGVIRVGEGATFVGQLMDGVPHGFGIRKEGDSVFTGIWNSNHLERSWKDEDFEAFSRFEP